MAVLLALSNIPTADAAPSLRECIDNCDRNSDGGLPRMICYAICAIFAK
ncbi:MAG: hypothetical protein PVI40_07520 [Chlamydiota bacterium]